MTINEAKIALKASYPHIKLEYESPTRILTLRNLVFSKRFGMGYAWHAFLTLEDINVVEVRFECHTSDTTSGVFHQALPAPKPIWNELHAVCSTMGLNMKISSCPS